MNNTIIAAVVTVILGSVFAAIGFLIKKSIVQKLDHLEEKVTSFKEEMLRDYVRRHEYEKNNESHEKIWLNLKAVEKSISRIEGRMNGNFK